MNSKLSIVNYPFLSICKCLPLFQKLGCDFDKGEKKGNGTFVQSLYVVLRKRQCFL